MHRRLTVPRPVDPVRRPARLLTLQQASAEVEAFAEALRKVGGG